MFKIEENKEKFWKSKVNVCYEDIEDFNDFFEDRVYVYVSKKLKHLEAENARFREALSEIVSYENSIGDCYDGALDTIEELINEAKQALNTNTQG